MARTNFEASQAGLTLLEILIALSIFSLIGIASFNVLSAVTETQKVGDEHSKRLSAIQRVINIIDRDVNQYVDRGIRTTSEPELSSLIINKGEYSLELTRGGWPNPLALSRSSLQRVAYDIGPHPLSAQSGSPYFGDERSYLRRLFWTSLDRADSANPVIQAMLPEVEELQISIITDKGRFPQWPLPDRDSGASESINILGLEVSFSVTGAGDISRLYKVH